jgi:hypothetical protein
MDIWGWLSVAVVLAILRFALWAPRHHSATYPAGYHSLREPDERDERKRELRWIGFIHGGGHG